MQTRLTPYLSFKDNAREAMEFYRSVFGGKLELATFEDFGMAKSPAEENKIMHSMLVTDRGLMIMGADTPNDMTFEPGARISMALSGDNQAELTGYFQKLSAGGTVKMPLEKAPWGDMFGMVTDKFGIE